MGRNENHKTENEKEKMDRTQKMMLQKKGCYRKIRAIWISNRN